MGKWRYEGFSRDGKKQKGEFFAKSKKEARRHLREKGVRIKKLTPPSVLDFDIGEWMVAQGFSRPFSVKILTHFTKQMSIMIGAGVSLTETLEILYRSQRHPGLKRSIKIIARDISEGKSISEALEGQRGFGKLYCSLIKAGESAGILDTILIKLAEHMESQEKTKSQIKRAMMYPGIVSLIGMGVIWAMMVFVVPQFVSMLTDSGQEVPWITQMVINVSNFLRNYFVITIVAAIVAAGFFISYVRTELGKVNFDAIMMKFPLIGGIIIKGNLASFTRTLSTMLRSGVPLVESLDICIETVDNEIIVKDLILVRKRTVEGGTLTDTFKRISYFPDMVAQMVRVGEQTGQIDTMLEKVSDVFEDEVSELVGDMTKMIEPIVIVVLGASVAGIMIAMYLPIFMSAGGVD